MSLRLSLIDFATIHPGQPVGEAFADSVRLAQMAEKTGRFERIWYAEHHNMPNIASSATSVLIAHVASQTSTIRLGAGGIMLPNHSPLVIAEQFGTLEALHPGRIDLGLGRAPGTDQTTVRALRRDPRASDRFPEDVQELQAFLSDTSAVPGVEAVPGKGTNVPLYILGSSLFGAQLAAALGLPYSFASHFAPDALEVAVATYRRQYRPSEQWPEPYVIAAANAVTADTVEEAEAISEEVLRRRVVSLVARNPQVRDHQFTEAEIDVLMDSPAGHQAKVMRTYTAVGGPTEVADYLADFREKADADEVMVAPHGLTVTQTLRNIELLGTI
ncbi:MAG: LLM class flavin-dependent oxidoreductase [Dermatophilus congolensis]|nr:LLM class flavin-dependent oxidoreductase [Dermatophilus congolensis]